MTSQLHHAKYHWDIINNSLVTTILFYIYNYKVFIVTDKKDNATMELADQGKFNLSIHVFAANLVMVESGNWVVLPFLLSSSFQFYILVSYNNTTLTEIYLSL